MANGGPGGQLDDLKKREENRKRRENREASEARAAAALKGLYFTPLPAGGSSDDDNASNLQSIRYPRDIGAGEANHFVIFDFLEYTAPFAKEATLGTGESGQSLAQYNSNNAKSGTKRANLPQVLLYAPEGIASSYKTNWDGKAFGNATAALLRTAGLASGNKGGFAAAMKKASEGVGDAIEKAPTIVAAQAISSLAKNIAGDSVGIQDIFSSVGGAILNPNVELIFGGTDLRTLQLTFKMVPYNYSEARDIDEIVRTFKQAMLPKFNGASQMTEFWGKGSDGDEKFGNGFIANPNIVNIQFMKGSSPNGSLPRFKPCAITDFDVNFTPDGVASFGPDGYPTSTTITLSLMETKLVYAEDIKEGY